MKNYSSLFKTIHEEASPAGCLGQNTHFSVLRAPSLAERSCKVEDVANYQNFAIIWNKENHHIVLEAAVKLFNEAKLFPLFFIGEEKGNFGIIIDNKIMTYFGVRWMGKYGTQVKKVIKSFDKSWISTVASVDNNPMQRRNDIVIEYELGWSFEYLKELAKVWDLGIYNNGTRVILKC